MPDEPVDAIGFSLGAHTLLRIACHQPRPVPAPGARRHRRAPCSTTTPAATDRIIAALEGHAPADDNIARLFTNYANEPGNDLAALTAVMKRPRGEPFTPETGRQGHLPHAGRHRRPRLRRAGRTAGRRVAGRASLVTLRTSTTSPHPRSFGFIDAALEFIDAVPVVIRCDRQLCRRCAGAVWSPMPTETVYGLAADAVERVGGPPDLRGQGSARRSSAHRARRRRVAPAALGRARAPEPPPPWPMRAGRAR